jgi:integrase/recombinase XerD
MWVGWGAGWGGRGVWGAVGDRLGLLGVTRTGWKPSARQIREGVVTTAARRAELPSITAHRLRHTAATEMLRAGATLPAVGQVLRHHSLLSTSLYAKADHRALVQLAPPWPGGGS